MKRKIILTLVIMAILMVALCITSFATYIYQDQDGNEIKDKSEEIEDEKSSEDKKEGESEKKDSSEKNKS